MSDRPSFEANRRTVIRGGAIGAGALLGALGLGAGTASASVPAAGVPDAADVAGAAAAVPTTADGGAFVDAVVAAAQTSDRVFLKLDGIAGESTLKGLEEWIELSDFSWGAQDTAASSTGGGGGAGRAAPLDTSFSGPTSKASPLLFRSTVTGQHIKTGQVVVARQAGGRLVQFLKWELTDVVIDFYKIDAPAAATPTDTGGLAFGRVRFSYYPVDSRGRVGEPVAVEWDTTTLKID
jgi:type VI secretion system secreted protein Hcp